MGSDSISQESHALRGRGSLSSSNVLQMLEKGSKASLVFSPKQGMFSSLRGTIGRSISRRLVSEGKEGIIMEWRLVVTGAWWGDAGTEQEEKA